MHKIRYQSKDGLIGFSCLYIGKYYAYHGHDEFTKTGNWGDPKLQSVIERSLRAANDHIITSGAGGFQSMKVTAKCTAVRIKGSLDPDYGIITVKVDDKVIANVDESNSRHVEGQTVFSFVVPLAIHAIELVRNASNQKPIDIYGISVLDNYGAGSFDIHVASNTVSAGETVAITVERLGGSNSPSGVDVSFVDGTAHNKEHYDALTQTLNFNDGETTKTLNIKIVKNIYKVGKRLTFAINITNPQNFGILGDTNCTDVTIIYTPLITDQAPNPNDPLGTKALL